MFKEILSVRSHCLRYRCLNVLYALSRKRVGLCCNVADVERHTENQCRQGYQVAASLALAQYDGFQAVLDAPSLRLMSRHVTSKSAAPPTALLGLPHAFF